MLKPVRVSTGDLLGARRQICRSLLLASGVEPWGSAELPVESASTPPASWYHDPAVLQLEAARVFARSWQLAEPRADQVQEPGQYAAGQLLNLRYVICRDEAGTLRAFHNVCRHHAAPVAKGSGTAALLRCAYHGWEYALDGRLKKATCLKGISHFSPAAHGLVPMQVAAWGPFLFVRAAVDAAGRLEAASCSGDGNEELAEWLGCGGDAALEAGVAVPRLHVATRSYDLRCNWKVFVDNYLDGGYHVPVAHPALAAGLDLATYRSSLHGRISLQRCAPAATGGDSGGRLGAGRPAAYTFVFPNLMVNTYGPWMDTNLVLPTSPRTCNVTFHYFLDPGRAGDRAFVEESLEASDAVQQEDIKLCEAVQSGLESPAYDTGRYAPVVEAPMHHFHRLLHAELFSA